MNWSEVSGYALLAVHPAAGAMALASPDPDKAGARLRVGEDSPAGWPAPWLPDGDGIVTIAVNGLLMPRGLYYGTVATSYDAIAAILERARARPDVSGVILDIDSPGGYASGCFSAARHIRDCPLPVAAVANPRACSAAYALASGAGRIFAQEDSVLGSIGVIALHIDCSKAMKRAGLAATVFRAGERKARPGPMEPLTDEDRAEVTAELQEINRQFVELVARNRGVGIDAIEGLQARCLPGSAALAARLSDEGGGMAQARAWIVRQARGDMNMQTERQSLAERLAAQMAAARGEGYANGVGAERQRIGAIASLCALADRHDLLGGFISGDTTPEQAALGLQQIRAGSQAAIDVAQAGSGQGQATAAPRIKPMSLYIEERYGGRNG